MTDISNITLTMPAECHPERHPEREPFQCRRCGKLWSDRSEGWLILPGVGEVCDRCKKPGEGE
jgi:hypothetical protein